MKKISLASKILFLKYGSFSKINENVFKMLQDQYPEYEIESFDVWELNKHNTSVYEYFVNVFFFFYEYGIEIIIGQKKWKEALQWFFATSYISIQMSKKIKKLHGGKNYKFTFQTQSIFNGKIENIPHFVYTDHTTRTNLLYPDINPRQYMRSSRFIHKSETKTYKEATMIFTFGNLVAQSLISQYQIPKEKIVTVYSGSNIPGNYNTKSNKVFSKNILFVGVEWERKGGSILLKVFENVLKTHPDASLTIVGCSPKNIKIPNCKIIGRVPVSSVANYYKDASIFCLPTMREPFGVVFVEAMSYKLPVIANNIGCLPDIIKNGYNGYLVDNNIEDYSKTICDLLENPAKCQQMGENGFNYAKSKFTWKTVGQLISQKINTALAKTKSSVYY